MPRKRIPQSARRRTDASATVHGPLEYLTLTAGLMGLSGWRIMLDSHHPDDGNVASVEVIDGQHSAVYRFAPDLWEQDPEAIRDTVAHEHQHVLYWQTLVAAEALADQLSPQARELGVKLFTQAWENATEDAARVVARLLPLPHKGRTR